MKQKIFACKQMQNVGDVNKNLCFYMQSWFDSIYIIFMRLKKIKFVSFENNMQSLVY